MSKILFADMKIGNTYKATVLLTGIVQKTTKTGKSYLELELSDGEARITAKMWDTVRETFLHKVNSLVDVSLYPKDYNGATDYTVNEVSACIDRSLKIEDFIIKIPYDVNTLFDNIIKMVKSSPDPRFAYESEGEQTISELTVRLLERYRNDYSTWAAAKSIHHAIYGGLVYHSFRMCTSAYMLSRVYRIADREMLVCGAVLHDIGKLIELSSELGVADYTPAGRLLGHAYIGMRMIEDESRNGNYNEERIKVLLHLIASHHGLGEFGAITYPATLEADILHQIDVIDAHAYEYETELVSVTPGDTSDKKIFGLDGNTIYRPAYLTDEIMGILNDPELYSPKG